MSTADGIRPEKFALKKGKKKRTQFLQRCCHVIFGEYFHGHVCLQTNGHRRRRIDTMQLHIQTHSRQRLRGTKCVNERIAGGKTNLEPERLNVES
jgi:hypothetical protein